MLVVIIATVLSSVSEKPLIDDFQACKEAGGSVATSYPAQCFIDGDSFVNEEQAAQVDGNYIGLGELEAIRQAADSNKPARVIVRDGEALPVTMDYVPGRLNFHVEDGKVKKVDVEGED